MVVSFFALAEAAIEVVPHTFEVDDLTPVGVEPHDLELTSDQVDKIEDADVVVLIPGFQPAVDRAAKRAKGTVVEISVEGDPHLWLDPNGMSTIASQIAAAVRGGNAARFDEALRALDGEYVEATRQCDRRTIVTAHDAFSRWSRYDLDVRALTGSSPEAEPDPKRLAELADLIRRTRTTTVFAEELLPQGPAETLARETGTKVEVLDPLESGTRGTYLKVMRENLAKLRVALGCR